MSVLWIPQSHPSPRHYLFGLRPPTIRYYGHKPNRPSWRVSGRHASAGQAGAACLAAMGVSRVECEAMDRWADEGGSAASFRAKGSPDHETILWQEEMEAQSPDELIDTRPMSYPSSLHSDFFVYEIQPDNFVEFFRTGSKGPSGNPPRLRIQYWAVVGTSFEYNSETDYHHKIVSGGFRDWGKGYALGAFKENLPNDARIIAEYVTLRFVGRLA